MNFSKKFTKDSWNIIAGEVEHTFAELSYHDLDDFCLAITDKAASVSRKNARTPKFIAAGLTFFKAFEIFNFHNVQFLSSGTSAYV